MSTTIRGLLAALLLSGLTACTATPTADSDPATPAPSTSGSPPWLTLAGTVREGVEAGCLVVRVDGATYLLIGTAAAELRAGDRVRLVGAAEPDAATSCMQGIAFRVRRVESLP
jgi:hypothetical protein